MRTCRRVPQPWCHGRGQLRTWLTSALVVLFSGFAAGAIAAQKTASNDGASINSGLGPAPTLVLRSSPASTWRSFFLLGDKGEFALAAHLLELIDIPPADQSRVGAEVAEKLYRVLRVLKARPADVSSEGLHGTGEEGVPTDSVMALRFQREKVAGEVWLRRAADERTGETAWLVGRQTVSSTPLWYRLLVERRTLEVTGNLNVGLGAPPENVFRASPRDALEGFLEASRAGHFTDAAHYLDLGALAPDRQASDGPLLARRLMFVLERRPWIDTAAVSRDPAGAPQPGMDDDRQKLGVVPTRGRDVAIVLTRYLDTERRFVWVFSRDTVSEIGTLYAAHGYGWLGDRLPRVLFATSLAGLQLWQWLSLALIVGAGFGVSRVIGHWLAVGLRKVAAQTPPTWDDYAVATVDGPLGIFLWAVIIAIAAKVVGLSPEATAVVKRVWEILLIVGFGWYFFKVLDAVSAHLNAQAQTGNSLTLAVVPILQRVGKFLVGLLVVLAALGVIGVNVAAALAGVGLGGLAIAFAAQKTLENIFGALSIAGDRPFKVGDFVQIGDVLGTVEDVGLRSTRLRTLSRTLVAIPNATVVADKIVNFAERDRILFKVTIGLVYGTTAAQLTFVLDEIRRLILDDTRVVLDGQRVRFAGFGASSLDVEVFALIDTTDYATYTAITEDLNFKIMEIVERSGSSFAFPSQTLYLARDSGRSDDRAEAAAAVVEARRQRGALVVPEPTGAQLEQARRKRSQ
jgi:MscS family membrane protein